jgi:DNA-binding transcriptional regulator YdaS (Cro superfamily)
VSTPRRSPAVATAVTGTVLIAAGAFWLSFTALADLARRSGIAPGQAWAWPLIVDGIIVVATVAVVALSARPGRGSVWYPWSLLLAGAGVSVTANAVHATISADADVPHPVAAAVAAVPPVVLLAITHLTVQLTRPAQPQVVEPHTVAATVVAPDSEPDRRRVAAALRGDGLSNRAIASRLGVHPSTVGRWLPAASGSEAQ